MVDCDSRVIIFCASDLTAITDLADKAKSYGRYGAKSKGPTAHRDIFWMCSSSFLICIIQTFVHQFPISDTSAGSAPDDHVTTDPVERHEPKVDYWQHEELQTFFAKNVMNSLPVTYLGARRNYYVHSEV